MFKKITLFLFILSLMTAVLCSCGQEKPETVTYAMLSEHEQAVVDYIYSCRTQWENGCTGVGFSTLDGTPVLCVSYYQQSGSDSISGWVRYYAYEKDTSQFDEIDSTYKHYTGYSSGTTFAPSFVITWKSNWNEAQKKDYLADRYVAYLSE